MSSQKGTSLKIVTLQRQLEHSIINCTVITTELSLSGFPSHKERDNILHFTKRKLHEVMKKENLKSLTISVI